MKLAKGTFLGRTKSLFHQEGLHVTQSLYTAAQEHPWHTHENTTLYIHIRGEHIDISEARSYRQEPFSVSFHPRDSPHRSTIGTLQMAGLNVDISDFWLQQYGLSDGALGGVHVENDPVLSQTVLTLLRHLAGPERLEAREPTEIAAVVLEVLSFFGTGDLAKASPPPWLHNVEELIREEYRTPLRLGQISAVAGVHPVHLARTFRFHRRCTIVEYIHLLRLREAVHLLNEKRIPAATVAPMVGFADQAHMIRSFRSHLGDSPKAFARLAAVFPAEC